MLIGAIAIQQIERCELLLPLDSQGTNQMCYKLTVLNGQLLQLLLRMHEIILFLVL